MTAAAGATTETAERTLFRGTYPGHPSKVAQVRHDLARVIAGCPVADELILLTSELCANAVLHSRSAKPGGRFTVIVDHCPEQSVQIEVMDQGGVWDDREHDDDRPHGLDIVHAIAGSGSWGIDGDGLTSRVVWVRLDSSAH